MTKRKPHNRKKRYPHKHTGLPQFGQLLLILCPHVDQIHTAIIKNTKIIRNKFVVESKAKKRIYRNKAYKTDSKNCATSHNNGSTWNGIVGASLQLLLYAYTVCCILHALVSMTRFGAEITNMRIKKNGKQ